MRERRDAVAFEDRRFQALDLYRKGLSQADIARQLRVSRAAVCQWLKKAAKKGKLALRRKPRPGRPPKLTDSQRRQLVKLLARGAESAGYATQLWTAERIQRLVLEQFGSHYHVNHVPKLLRQCGWSYQRPTGRAIERNETEVRRWIREEWPRIKKKPSGRKPH
jgi:Transposase and inactivated derivatives